MSKISKKILFVFIALIFIFCITTNSYATDITPDGSEDTNDSTITEGTTSLEIVENNISFNLYKGQKLGIIGENRNR